MSLKKGDKMEIIRLNINDITPYEKNAKIHTETQIEQIKKSIQEFGMNDPIAVWVKTIP
jgi:ParB-like chromosome segregation protein Spo0J